MRTKYLMLVFTLVLLFGCTAKNVPTAKIEVSTSPTIEVKGFAFEPNEVRIKAGDTVTWINQDSVQHTIKFDSGKGVTDSAEIAQGESFSQRFDKAGTYSYHCSIHPSMSGKVIVE